MKFYSGFSLKNDKHFFKEYINDSNYSVSGFSYGAIKALLHVENELGLGRRVDTLQLFSPAFFQTKSLKFKKLQTISYLKSQNSYIENFIELCFSPYLKKRCEHIESSSQELKELLYYEYNRADFLYLQDRGVKIEVYLGGEDKIIDITEAKEFFLDIATVTYIKNANHFLQTD